MIRGCLLISILFAASVAVGQQAPPPQDNIAPEPTIRVRTSAVLVPTLVEQPNGEVVYGLKPGDFELYDNGVKQKLHVDEEMDTAPVSVAVVLQTGRSAALEYREIERIPSLLDFFLGDGKSDAALVTFDSQPRLLQDFTPDASRINNAIHQIQPGDGGAAIYDATAFTLDLLQDLPPDRRRVLLLISETRDHGSKEVKIDQLIKQIGASNTLVVSLAFSPVASEYSSEFMNDLKYGSGGNLDLLAPFVAAVNAARKNVAREIAIMSGGEYAPFHKERTFEERIHTISEHSRNRYLLSFQPAHPTPGLHVLDVKLTSSINARVITRINYWAEADPSTTP